MSKVLTVPEKVAVRQTFSAHGKDVDLTYGEAMLKDGSMLVWDGDLMQGTPVFVSTPEGTLPAPDGVLELEDGSMIDVVGGIVQAIKPADQPADQPADAAPADTTANPVSQEAERQPKSVVKSVVEEHRFEEAKTEEKEEEVKYMAESEVSEMVEKAVKEATDKVTEDYTAKFNEMKEIVLKVVDMLKEPAAKPTEQPKTAFQKQVETKQEREDKFSSYISQLRNK